MIASAPRVVDGETVTFHFEMAHGNVDKSLLKYNWMIERGRIVSGQGTPVVIVDTTGAGPAGSVTATIEIGGPYPECCWLTSETVRVRRKGQLSKPDVFWEWFVENTDRIRYYDSPYIKGETEILDELSERLREVDPKLTFKILAAEPYGNARKIVIGYSLRSSRKVLDDLISRAPVMPQWILIEQQ